MNQKILRLVDQIKENLKEIELDGVTHALFDDVYDKLGEIEDVIYDSEMDDRFLTEEDDF